MTYKYLGSSQNPEQLALRVKSALYAFIPLLVLVLKIKGLDLNESTFQPYVDAIYNIIIWGGFVITGAIHAYAWVRAFFK